MRKVFLSSTVRDLTEYRNKAYHAIEGMDGFHCVRMEDFGARDAQTYEFCRKKIVACDAAVFLIGLCYGSTPEGADETYTAQEYRIAREIKVPRLVFLSGDDEYYSGYFRESDTSWKRLQEFRELVSKERLAERSFGTPEDLARKVVTAISNWASESETDKASPLTQEERAIASDQVAGVKDVRDHVLIINVDAANLDPDKLWRLITKRTPPIDLKQVTEQFIETIVEKYRYLDFRGMGVSDRIPLKLPLLEMYVPLRARTELPAGETWTREFKLAGREASEEEVQAMGQRLSEPQLVLELLTKHDGLIILGDPGSGKTTFLKFLALALATEQGNALGLGARLPVLLPLSAYASALDDKDLPLDRFIDQFYRDRGVDLPAEAMLQQALAHGGALLLLDGLDEVKDLSQRHLVIERVTDFYSFHRRKGNKFVLTSRVVGYPEVRPRVECTLVEFENEDIEEFITRWTKALEKAARGATNVADFEAQREREELLSAVHGNPGVRTLASNPLLLTILALMKRQGVELPERRVELYQAYVEILLKHWNLARSLAGRAGSTLDTVETMRILAPLALWIHRNSPGVGLVKEGDLRRELERVFLERGHEEADLAVGDFLEDVRNVSSLLIDRGGRQYGFIHLTFQEYLAGVALAQMGQQDINPIVRELAAHVGDDTWREVSLLCIGFLGII